MAEQVYWDDDPRTEEPEDPAAAAWLLVLDVLEMAVTAAERTLNDPLGPLSAPLHQPESALPVQRWSPPVLSGPLPPEARRRAMALSAAQERVAKRLEAAKQDVSRQLHALSTVPSLSSPSRAVYLDVQG